MYKISQIEIATIELLSNNIFHITANSGAKVDFVAAKKLIAAINEMLPSDNSKRAGIFDLSQIGNVDNEAANYLVSGKDLEGIVTGVALISYTDLGKAVGEMIVSMHSPKTFPIQFFNSPMRAEHWVRTRMKNTRSGLLVSSQYANRKSVA